MIELNLSQTGECLGGRIEYIRDSIRFYIIRNFMLESDEILADDDSLIDSGIVDSTSALELAEFIGQTFGIKVSEYELSPENFDTIERLSAFIIRKSSVEAAA